MLVAVPISPSVIVVSNLMMMMMTAIVSNLATRISTGLQLLRGSTDPERHVFRDEVDSVRSIENQDIGGFQLLRDFDAKRGLPHEIA